MPIYSEPLDKKELLERLKDARSVLIVGCPLCTNISLAYFRDRSAYKLSLFGIKAYAVETETSKLRRELEERGTKVRAFGLSMPSLLSGSNCYMTYVKRRMLLKASKGVDVVITLCCIAGHVAIKDILKGKTRVVRGMKTLGSLSTSLSLRNFNVVIKKERTFVIKGHRLKE